MLWVLRVVLVAVCVGAAEGGGECEYSEKDGALRCETRILNASITDHPKAKSVIMTCSDVFLYESVIRTNHFGYRPDLRNLEVRGCKIGEIPALAFSGLSGLRNLILKTENREWAAMTMEIREDAFTGLNSLLRLDLSSNNLWRLPESGLCGLDKLKKLNLSGNYLRDSDLRVFSLSESRGCEAPLGTLDLSYNSISSLPSKTFSSLSSLLALSLNSNEMERIQDEALFGLIALKIIDLSDNALVALPPLIFRDCASTLEELYLENNSLSVLAPGIFKGMENLKALNLSRNDIGDDWLDGEETFSSLKSLITLDLSGNRLESIKPSLFNGLSSLEALDLKDNFLSALPPQTFFRLGGLRVLWLSRNAIKSLQSGSFKGCEGLNSLSLDSNALLSLDKDVFSNMTELENLALNGNALQTLPEGLFRKTKSLKMLDLGDNKISDIKNTPFKGLKNLYGLRLAENGLSILHENLFSELNTLQVLNLAHNDIESLPQSIFNSLTELRILKLDQNKLEDIDGLLTTQSELRYLNISANLIQWFDYASIPKNLKWLDLHDNRIVDLGNYYKLKDGYSLKTLDASNNRIEKLGILSLLNSLEYVFLNDNNISEIEPSAFEFKPFLRRVEIVRNRLTHLQFSVLVVSPSSHSEKNFSPEFFLGQNPYYCDCEMEYLKKINQLSLNPQRPRVMDIDDVLCAIQQISPSSGNKIPPRAIAEIPSKEFLCPYTAHCFALCMCCDFFACDCRMQCPEGCTCYHDSTWSANVIQCSMRGHSDVPRLIPMDATSIYLDGNNFTGILESQAFIGRKKVDSLYLNASQIAAVSNQTFNGLSELEVLHLEDNFIRRLEGYEFTNLTSLKELLLQNNLLHFIDVVTFASLTSLETLRLDGNLLVSFGVWNDIPHISKSLNLSGNPWSCACGFLKDFKEYIANDFIADGEEIRCGTSPSSGISLLRDNATCSDALAVIYDGRTRLSGKGLMGERRNLIPISVSVIAICVVLAVSSVMIFVFRTPLRVWLHSKYGVRLQKDAGGRSEDKLYDAYVSYSVKDEEFVRQILTPQLEEEYKLCLQHRDMPGGAESLPGMSQLCAKQVLVVSKSYLETEWIRTKFSAPRDPKTWKPIVLLIEELSSLDLAATPEFNILLKTAVVLRWNETGFWNKLRFYLPDSSKVGSGDGANGWSHYECTIPSNNSSASTRSTIVGGSSPKTLNDASSDSHPTPSHHQKTRTSLITNPLEGLPLQRHHHPWGSSSDKSDSVYSWMDHTYQTIGGESGGDFPSGGGRYNPIGNLDVILPDGRTVPATLVRNSKDGRILPLVQVSNGENEDDELRPGPVTFPRTVVYKAPETERVPSKGGYLV